MKSILMKISPASGPGTHLLLKKGLVILLSTFMALQGCIKHPEPPVPVTTPGLKLVADNLVSPIGIFEAPDKSGLRYIVDQIGKIWILGNDGNVRPNPFFDISSKMVRLAAGYDERGLLGLAFHPKFKENGKFYVYYNALPRPGGPAPGVNWNCIDRVSEFIVSPGNPTITDMSSERILIDQDDPQSNHNGGTLAFGPDGYLYVSIGDGGGANDNGAGHVPDWYLVNTGGNGQDVYANLLGNILRIDVNNGAPYGIPPDNPFVNGPGKDEIYAYGFRNPYRFSIDMGGTHQLIVGDAGQNLWEEVDVVKKGGNYGWNVKEGTHCFNTDNPLTVRPSCPIVDTAGNPLIDPVIEFGTASNPNGGLGLTVIGGNIYRGNDMPDLKGKYIFAVFSKTGTAPQGKLYVGTPQSSGMWPFTELNPVGYPTDLGMYVKGFGQTLDGEMYVAATGVQGPSGTTGKVFKIVNTTPPAK